MAVGSARVTDAQTMDSGEKRLAELGYKQELKRDLSLVSNFAFSFAIISILTGVSTLFNTGLTYGGTISMVYGWLLVGAFTVLVGLSMAEICSAFPTSGGLYYWSSQLAGPEWGPFASWFTGWYNVVGQWATTCAVEFSLAQLLQVMILLATGGANGGGYLASKYVLIAMHGGILFFHALINSLNITWLSYVTIMAAAWNVVGVVLLIVLIPAVATQRQTASSVFTAFNKPDVGIHNNVYIFLLGLLMSQYNLSAYDASAHMSEETKSSDTNGAYGILTSIITSIVFGWAYILGLTFVVIDPTALLDPTNDAGGYAIAQIFYDAFKTRYGNGTGGIVCLGVIAVAIFLCGLSSVTSNSRMLYAFSRDGAVPFSRFWVKSLGSLVAFQAMVSIATIGLYISYALPTLFRITIGRKSFRPGPFNLGRYSLIVGWVAVIWVAFITVLFCLPIVYPVSSTTLNYTPVAIGGLFVLIMSSWLLSARKWFKGPQFYVDDSLHGKKDGHP